MELTKDEKRKQLSLEKETEVKKLKLTDNSFLDEFNQFQNIGTKFEYKLTENDFLEFKSIERTLTTQQDEEWIFKEKLANGSYEILTLKTDETFRQNVDVNFERGKKNALLRFLRDEIFCKSWFKFLSKKNYYYSANIVVAGGCVEYLIGSTTTFGDIDVFIEFNNQNPTTCSKSHISYILNKNNNEFYFYTTENSGDDTHYGRLFCCFDLYEADWISEGNIRKGKRIKFEYGNEKHPVQVIVKFSYKTKLYYEHLKSKKTSEFLKKYLQHLDLPFPKNIVATFDFPVICGSGLIFDEEKNKFQFFIVTETSVDFRDFLNARRVNRVLKYLKRQRPIYDKYGNIVGIYIPSFNKRLEPYKIFKTDEFNISYECFKIDNDENNCESYDLKDLIRDWMEKEKKKEIVKDENEYFSLFKKYTISTIKTIGNKICPIFHEIKNIRFGGNM